MASPTWWTWVWASFDSWWWIGKPGVLQFMGSQGVGHNWAKDLNWTEHTGQNFRKWNCSKKEKGWLDSSFIFHVKMIRLNSLRALKNIVFHLLITKFFKNCSVQSLSCVWLFATPWITARQASLSITNSWSSLKLKSIESVCHPAISSSVVPFSSCPQSLPASGSFPVSQLFAWGGQSIGVSASASVLPVNTQDWSPLGWTGWISLQSKGLLRVFSNTTVQKHQFFGAQLLYMTTGKTIALTRRTFVGKVMSLLFNMPSRLVITFLPSSKYLLISWLQSPSAVILEPKKIKSDTFHCFPIYLPWSDGTGCHDLRFLNVEL